MRNNSPCSLEDRTNGQCLDIRECPYVYNLFITQNRITNLCGYNQQFPVVCCPLDDKSGTINQNEKLQQRIPGTLSKKKCQEYNYPIHEIFNGQKSLAKEFPHMAAIGYGEKSKKKWLCGGALVSEKFVLTAAHCLRGHAGPPKYVRLGDLDIESTDDDASPQEFTVVKVIAHPQYRHPAKYNDIAVIQLDRDISESAYVGIACLDTIRHHKEKTMTATGWGQTEFSGGSSSHLLKADLEVVDNGKCRSVYGMDQKNLPSGIVNDVMICAGGKSDTCYGDSGGPLVTRNEERSSSKDVYNVVGITSFGKVCGVSGDAGVYTRVQPYLKWLENILWPNE